MTREQMDREMQESARMQQHTWQNISNGTRNAMDDIRRHTVEQPWYGRTLDAPYERPTTGFYTSVIPERSADTGTENPGTMHQSPADQDKGQGGGGNGVHGTPTGQGPGGGPGGNSIDAFYGRAQSAPEQSTLQQNPADQGKTAQDDTMQRFYGPGREAGQGQPPEVGKSHGQGMEP